MHQLQALSTIIRLMDGSLQVTGRLDDVATAQAALAQMQQKQQQSLVGGMVLEAKFGGPDQSMTKALTRCLQVDQCHLPWLLKGQPSGGH